MIDLIRVDMYKMAKSSLIRTVFAVSILSAGLLLVSAHFIATGDIDLQGTGIPSLFADSQIFTLLGCVIIGMFLCNDFEYKIIENAISSGHSRNMVVVSKVISLMILISILSLPYCMITILSASFNFDVSVFMPTAFLTILGIASNGADILDILIFIILAILIYSAQLSVGIFIMFLVKKPVMAIALSYIALLFFGPILSLSDITKNMMTYTPFGIDYTQLVTNFEIVNMIKPISISIIFIAVFTFLSMLSFRKCDIK